MRVGEGKSEVGQGSGIGRWRVEEVWVLSLARDIARDGIGAADAGGAAGRGNLIGGRRRGGIAAPATTAVERRSRRENPFIASSCSASMRRGSLGLGCERLLHEFYLSNRMRSHRRDET
jgi:hypothetical protein